MSRGGHTTATSHGQVLATLVPDTRCCCLDAAADAGGIGSGMDSSANRPVSARTSASRMTANDRGARARVRTVFARNRGDGGSAVVGHGERNYVISTPSGRRDRPLLRTFVLYGSSLARHRVSVGPRRVVAATANESAGRSYRGNTSSWRECPGWIIDLQRSCAGLRSLAESGLTLSLDAGSCGRRDPFSHASGARQALPSKCPRSCSGVVEQPRKKAFY